MDEMGTETERYTLNVRTDLAVPAVEVVDSQTNEFAAFYSGPDALLKATAELARLQWRDSVNAADTDNCCVKISPGNAPCGLLCEFLTAERAQQSGRGLHSGWYHVQSGTDHHAVPKSWVS